ncbi:MAG: PAS domain S-box protein [Desulfuromonadaceae bacterium]|nr:PAS domain S-box protein [Desulfuromonadaceae bacterium]
MKSDTDSFPHKSDEVIKIRRYMVITAMLWTILIFGMLFAYILDNRRAVHEIGHSTMDAAFEEEILLHRWAARHGGVYVPVTEDTPSNPLLANVPERDITTPSGRRLTLVPTALISRQLFELAPKQAGIPKGHITSLNPIRPENAPDAWEMKALKAFEQGKKEEVEPILVHGEPHLRFMRPLVTEKSCLECHAAQGYKEGDVRGGISLTLSLDHINKAMKSEMQHEAFVHTVTWLLGMGFIWFGTRRFTHVMTLLQDERNKLHRNEASLRTNQRQLTDIIEFLPDATFAIDKEKRVIIWNRAIEDMTGVNAAEMIGKGEYAYAVPFYGEARPQLIDLLFTEREEIAARYPNITRAGDTLMSEVFCHALHNNKGAWVFAKASPLHDQSGNIIGAIEIIRDITELKQTVDELQETEERYRALFTRASDGIFIMSTEGKLIEVNDSFARMHGYSAEEMQQMNLWDLDTVETSSLAPERVRRLLSGETLAFEVEHYHKEGHVFPLEVSASMIYSGGDSYIQCFHRDISERKLAEEERIQLEQQFHHAQKLESLGVLAGGIAHDFNNILTVILGHCYMARQDMNSEQEFKVSFQHVENAANRAADLCRQMLTYAGRSESEQTLISLRMLVEEVVKMLQSTLKKNVTIELDLLHDIPIIRGDNGQIQQIVMNLIINAAEAIGEVNGRVKVALAKALILPEQIFTDTFGTIINPGSYACLEVSDTGCGMDEETQKRIFEPFFTTKFTGRGLGMSAIHGIIKSHEAALQMSSTLGAGTTFKVFFPMSGASDYAVNRSSESATSVKGGGKILLVDDEQTLRNIGTALLEALGFSVIVATNGSEALEIYGEQSSEIDAILLDLIMPVMGGIETYNKLRNIASAIPIIICSGYSEGEVSEIIKNDRHAGFMSKPYNPIELREVMVRMMERSGNLQ